MALYYFDTSALVKRYVDEVGSNWVITLTADPSSQVAASRIIGPELVAALARKVRIGELSAEEARWQIEQLRSEWESAFLLIELASSIAYRAMDLAEQYGLRGYDATHVATALEVSTERPRFTSAPVVFVSADAAQVAVAQSEGLATENPNLHA